MTILLVETYHIYRKGAKEVLHESEATRYNSSMRQEIIEDYKHWNSHDNIEDFITRKQDSVNFYRDTNDPNEPIGVIVAIKTYKQKRKEIKEEYKTALKNLKEQFLEAEFE